jgi:glycerophosphoryl diester phosphodiesterase
MNEHRPTVIAHRGAKATHPENTLAAFAAAIEAGADWLELDIHLADGHLVVIHDPRLERTTNGTGRVADCTISYLRGLDAGNGERIPLLEEVLELARGRVSLNVELKSLGIAEPASKALRSALSTGWQPQQLCVSSFFHHELAGFAGLAPEIPRAALTMAVPLGYAKFAEELGCIAVNASEEFFDMAFVSDAHSRGLEFNLYTVNHREDYKFFADCGVDGVFTDNPSLLLT